MGEIMTTLTNIKSKLIKIILMLFALVSLMIPSYANEINLINKSSDFYVNDNSYVLDKSVKDHIISVNKNFEKTNEKPQIVVATIPSLNGEYIDDYAVKLFEKFKIGNKNLDNGVLVLLATSDRQMRIEVGYGLEGVITDSKAGSIVDGNIKYLKEENYSKALENIFNNIAYEISEEYQFPEKVFDRSDSSNYLISKLTFKKKLIGFVIAIVLIILDSMFNQGRLTWIILEILANSNGSRGRRSGGHSGGGGRSGGGGASRGF